MCVCVCSIRIGCKTGPSASSATILEYHIFTSLSCLSVSPSLHLSLQPSPLSLRLRVCVCVCVCVCVSVSVYLCLSLSLSPSFLTLSLPPLSLFLPPSLLLGVGFCCPYLSSLRTPRSLMPCQHLSESSLVETTEPESVSERRELQAFVGRKCFDHPAEGSPFISPTPTSPHFTLTHQRPQQHPNYKHWFTTSFLQPLTYLVMS